MFEFLSGTDCIRLLIADFVHAIRLSRVLQFSSKLRSQLLSYLILAALVTSVALSSQTITSTKHEASPPNLLSNAPLMPEGFNDTLLAEYNGRTPIDTAWTPDGRMIVAVQQGQLPIYEDGELQTNSSIDLSAVICTQKEMGLLSVTTHPNFASNNFIYIFYTHRGATGSCNLGSVNGPFNRVSRFTLTESNTIDLASELVLLRTQPLTTGDHNAGDLKFGKDGLLYIASGNGGTAKVFATTSQDLGSLQGKILRVTDNGDIPSGNPYTGQDSVRCNVSGAVPAGSPVGAKCREVYAYGLRNPFRFAFDPNAADTRFFINDVGESIWEEIDLGANSANYGWPIREGPCATGSTTDCSPQQQFGLTDPIAYYTHDTTAGGKHCICITGSAFVPAGVWPTSFDGAYLFADWGCGGVWTLTPNGDGTFTTRDFAVLDQFGPTSMRFGPSGNSQALYYVTQAHGGQLRKIAWTPPAVVHIPDFAISVKTAVISGSVENLVNTTLTVAGTGGFAGNVDLTVTSNPTGLSCSVSPMSATVSNPNGTAMSILSCKGEAGSYAVTVTGNGAGKSHGALITYILSKPKSPPLSTPLLSGLLFGLSPIIFYALVGIAGVVITGIVVATRRLSRQLENVEPNI